MKKIKYILLLSIGMMFTSCMSFLDREPIDFVTTQDYKTASSILEALNGTYRSLIYRTGNRIQPMNQDFMADDGYCDDPSHGPLQIWKMNQTPTDDACVREKWTRDYQGIARANTVIQYAPLVDELKKSDAQRYIAEAKVLRAYFYADLIEFYGDVPFRTEPEGLAQKISPRVEKEKILWNILLDLDEAAKVLPIDYKTLADYGRVTKGAAYALKARICLYNKKYDWAIQACYDVIGLNRYQLHPSYKELFTAAVEKTNQEYILTQQYIGGTSSVLSANYWTLFSAFAAYKVSENLVEEYYMKSTGMRFDSENSGYNKYSHFTDRDPRMGYTIKTMQGSMDGVSHTGYRVQKFVDDDYNSGKVHNNDETDFPLIRYADVLLMLAESLVERGTYDYDEVVGLVDQVRQREDVKMPKIQDSEESRKGAKLSREELRDVIRHERRVEFALEGLRYSDIKRWEIGDTTMGDCYSLKKVDDGSGGTYYERAVFAQRTFIPSKVYLWPIPIIETQTNPMPNNPGY